MTPVQRLEYTEDIPQIMKKGWSSFMERRVKERLVGATILVVLIVVIVPELLSGPKRARAPDRSAAGDRVRTITVDLATRKATPGADEFATAATTTPGGSASAVSASGDATAPAAAISGTNASAGGPSASGPPTITTLQAQQPAAPFIDNHPASKSVAAPSKLDARSGWAVQLGSFESRENALVLVRQVRAQGFTAVVSSSGAGKSLRHRVRVGPMGDRAGAEKVLAQLRKDGHPGSLVSP